MSGIGNNSFSKRTVWSFVLIVAVALICFYPTLQNGLLIWDDSGYILENTNIRQLNLETLRWAFTTFYVNYWAPLTWISLAVDYAFWGLNPVGYHLTNNVIHALNAGLFFLLLQSLFQFHISVRGNGSGTASVITSTSGFYCALLAALLFAVHPLRVQSVAWATERKDVLAVFFGVLSAIWYVRYARQAQQVEEPGRSVSVFLVSKYYWLSLLFYCFSLLSKSMLVVMPLLLLVLDWFPLRRYSKNKAAAILLEKIPFFLLAGIASLLTVQSQGESLMSIAQTDLTSRLLLACKSIMLYIWMTIWPLEISPFYVHPGRSISSAGFELLLPLLLCILLSVVCLVMIRRWPVIATVWLIYLIALFPVLGFTQTGPEGMAARFTYVPGMALAFLISLGVTALSVKRGYLSAVSIVSIFIVSSMLLMYCVVTRRDISHWKSDVSLWTRVIDLKPHTTGRAYYERGYAYFLSGNFDRALDDTNEALRIAASKNYNRIYEIQVQRARILGQMGKLEDAVAAYSEAIHLDSSQMRNVYFAERGNMYLQMGKTELAENDFRQAGMR